MSVTFGRMRPSAVFELVGGTATGLAVLAGITYWAFTPQISMGLLPAGLIAQLVTSGVTVLRRRRAPGLPLGSAVHVS